jgi:hypothetical protein
MQNNTIIIKGNNNYMLEGSQAGSWTIKVIDNNKLLTPSIIEQLKDFKEVIFFNDLSGKHWIFDFKIKNVWFEAKNINCCKMQILLNAFI